MHRAHRASTKGRKIGGSVGCTWSANELDHPVHHACEFFSALDGWEDVGDPEFLDGTSEQF